MFARLFDSSPPIAASVAGLNSCTAVLALTYCAANPGVLLPPLDRADRRAFLFARWARRQRRRPAGSLPFRGMVSRLPDAEACPVPSLVARRAGRGRPRRWGEMGVAEGPEGGVDGQCIAP